MKQFLSTYRKTQLFFIVKVGIAIISPFWQPADFTVPFLSQNDVSTGNLEKYCFTVL